nr:TPM domain-containing protein [Microvirga solisilvae]
MVVAAPLAAHAQNFPPLTGRVVDAANLLTPNKRATFEARLKAHEESTTNQVVLATVPSLEGVSIEDYANRLFRSWKLGQQDKNNGVLLLIAPKEREIRIEVGYGLEGTLTDAFAKLIIANVITPRFKQGRYADGIDGGLSSILDVLTGKADISAHIITPDGVRPVLRDPTVVEQVTEQGIFRPAPKKLWFGFDPFFVIIFGAICINGIFVLLTAIFGPKHWLLKSVSRSGRRGSGGGSFGSSRSSFSGGGGSSGGGGASGRW